MFPGSIVMTSAQRFSRFGGIDIAKNKHVACVLDRDGQIIQKAFAFGNDAEGYGRLLERLEQAGGASQVLIAMEATGHYWYSLHEYLVRRGWTVVVLNPIQTAQQVKKGIRKS